MPSIKGVTTKLNTDPKSLLKKDKIGVFTLVMINVAAIIGLRNLPLIAEFGGAAIVMVLMAAVIYFFPVALVSAELATGWSKGGGGVFVWSSEAYSPRFGFLSIWLQWIQNVIWFPAELAFAAGTLSYVFNPKLATNKNYILLVVVISFAFCIAINLFGLKTSGLVSSAGAIAGIFIPVIAIVVLCVIWLLKGNPSQIDWSNGIISAQFFDLKNMVLLAGVFLGMSGLEMSAVFANKVKKPQKNYPLAILFSAIIIISILLIGSLAIAVVVPQKELSLVAGVMQAFEVLVKTVHLEWIIPILALLIFVGPIVRVSTWVSGPNEGLLRTARDGYMPSIFKHTNKHGMPTSLFTLQGVIFLFCLLPFFFMPNINAVFWLLTALSAQLYLIMYVFLFLSGIVLRYRQPDVKRAFRVPGGNYGMWIVAGIGCLASLFGIFIGFLPPSQLDMGSYSNYLAFLLIGITIFCAAPFIMYSFRKKEKTDKL